ncbi:MAG: hypothetical protein QNJ35_14170 [Paracoccaceae bacterium]|nr:hypothetical protein [Paracoccaceae bacterium]
MLNRKGDQADRLCQIDAGEIELVDIGKRLHPVALIGEIALSRPLGRAH